MTMNKWMITLLLNACALWASAWSQRLIDVTSSLSNNQVLCLAIDNEGYVWAGTEAGLNRIGAGFCTQPNKLPEWRHGSRGNSDKVMSLYYDSGSGMLLVGTESGLDIIDSRTGTYRTGTTGDKLLNFAVGGMAADHRGGVWVLYDNGSVQHVDCKGLKVSALPVKSDIGNRCGLDDGEGHLYIGYSRGGMGIVDSRTGKRIAKYVHQQGDATGIPGNNVRCICQDSRRRIWVGTDHGLALFQPEKGTFQTVRPKDSPYDDNVFDIREMTDGRLWVACDVGGIKTLDCRRPDTELAFDDERTDINTRLASLNSRCLAEDGYGNIWVGSHSTGIDFLTDREPVLHLLPYWKQTGRHDRLQAVNAIADDGEGRLWVNGEDELSLWQGETLMGAWPMRGLANRAHSFARSMMADHEGRVWLGMEDEGVVRFDPQSKQFEYIDIGYDVPDIHSFFEDEDGRVWIGSEYGVCTYRNGVVSHESQIDRLLGAPVTSFVPSGRSLLMATQGNGVVIYDRDTGTSRHLHTADGLLSENINQALADGYGGIWLATNRGVAFLRDTGQRLNVVCYDGRHGLPNSQVQAIALDRDGRLWASTFTHLSCLDRTTETFHNYSGNAALQTGGFVAGSVARMAGGLLAFGSSNGVCYVNPDINAVGNDTARPKIAVCNVYQTTADGTQTISLLPDEKGNIALSYQQNTLRILATVDNYAQFGAVDMAYKMKGLENKWYDLNDRMDVTFRSLPPGNYTFVLRAKLKNQNWDDGRETQIAISIAPPFWRSWWAQTAYLLLAAFVIVYFFRGYKHRLALQNSLEMARRESLQKQELNEERLRFFTNITHELRTPLTLILGPLEDLAADSSLATASRRKVEMINKSAGRLRDLINQILEFRKTETQNRRLTVARGDIGQFVREIVLNYRELNRNSKVAIAYDQQDSLPQVYFDSEVIATVLNNLLSNAVKYTEQGRIDVTVTTNDDGQLLISVADTGYGIAAEALPHVFDRYYQVKGSHQASGTGIGLALVKALTDLHDAQITVQSQEGKGCEFTVALSIANTYPNALHKSEETTAKNGGAEAEDEDEVAEVQLPLLLIVEDNDDIRQYIADSLCDDYRIVQATNGQEGALMAAEQLPDLIVSDIMMPKMNGIQMTRQLKDSIQTSHIPIILLTAKDTDDDKEEGYDSGADSYLTKPFTAKLLTSRIRNLLANRRRLAEQLSNSGVESIAASTPAVQNSLGRLDREFMERLNHTIEEHIMQTDIDMAFLTDKMAMSHSTFYRKVKALTGLTAKEYVRKQRLRHCYKLIESGDYNVTEAAMMTGFNQMAHFREVFKKEFGMLPSEVTKR